MEDGVSKKRGKGKTAKAAADEDEEEGGLEGGLGGFCAECPWD